MLSSFMGFCFLLEFFCKENCPFSHIYLCIQLFIYINMDLYIFLLFYGLSFHFIALATGSFFRLVLVSFWHAPIFLHKCLFWYHKIFQAHLVFSLLQPWNQPLFVTALNLSVGEWYLKIRISVPGVLTIFRVSLLLYSDSA